MPQLEYAIRTFTDAARRISRHYMALPMARQEALPLERVYCYELYHQLRTLYDDVFYWGGEVDKAGHVDFTGPGLRFKKPDLLLHQPGHHEGNLLVFEVKMARRITFKNVRSDLRTLTAFRRREGRFLPYRAAIFLLVGGGEEDIRRVQRWAGEQRGPEVNPELIQLWWHEGPSRTPQLIPWGLR